MAIPVMVVVSCIRRECNLTAKEVANELKIASGFLQQCESFEYIPDPDYICFDKSYLPRNITIFLEKYQDKVSVTLRTAIYIILQQRVRPSLILDMSFMSLTPILKNLILEDPPSKAYGPLFQTLQSLFFTDTNKGFQLKGTGNKVIDYLLNHIFLSTWGEKTLRRRKTGRENSFVYIPYLPELSPYIGQINGCHDLRSIFWFYEGYKSKRHVFVYLFTYLVLASINLNFTLQNTSDLPFTKLPTANCCHYYRSGECADMKSSNVKCSNITIYAPMKETLLLSWTNRNIGETTHYCIRNIDSPNISSC